jgi:flagellar basal body-associated protein FliL
MEKNKHLNKKEESKMKKIIIILSVLVTLSLAGALYGTQDRSDEGETVILEQVYDFIPDPMPSFPLY